MKELITTLENLKTTATRVVYETEDMKLRYEGGFWTVTRGLFSYTASTLAEAWKDSEFNAIHLQMW
jgi:hypothetical protein